jgi:hypothetical protein
MLCSRSEALSSAIMGCVTLSRAFARGSLQSRLIRSPDRYYKRETQLLLKNGTAAIAAAEIARRQSRPARHPGFTDRRLYPASGPSKRVYPLRKSPARACQHFENNGATQLTSACANIARQLLYEPGSSAPAEATCCR